ncbi:MAG: molybdenum cofactor guanylyltransferase, partial [Candidatus Aminicenantes bacterium]|nr:molybdenum cofactor guanylyltransferase [Candidatus Aminicenantes bacterium]
LAQLEPHFDEVLVSVSPGQGVGTAKTRRKPAGTRRKEPAKDDGRSRSATRRENRSPRVIVDEVPGLGPLGGIIAGLKAAANDACAVVACDIPDIDIPLLRSLAGAAASAEIAVPRDPEGRYEPLFAVYRRPIVPAVEALLRSGERSVLPLYDLCRTSVVDLEAGRRLTNLNTRADYQNYLKSLRPQ